MPSQLAEIVGHKPHRPRQSGAKADKKKRNQEKKKGDTGPKPKNNRVSFRPINLCRLVPAVILRARITFYRI